MLLVSYLRGSSVNAGWQAKSARPQLGSSFPDGVLERGSPVAALHTITERTVYDSDCLWRRASSFGCARRNLPLLPTREDLLLWRKLLLRNYPFDRSPVRPRGD